MRRLFCWLLVRCGGKRRLRCIFWGRRTRLIGSQRVHRRRVAKSCTGQVFYEILQNNRRRFGVNIAFLVTFFAGFETLFRFYRSERLVLKANLYPWDFLNEAPSKVPHILALFRLIPFVATGQTQHDKVCAVHF